MRSKNKQQRMLDLFQVETFPNWMKELMLCLVHQNLNEIPWGITLGEFALLEGIYRRDL